MKVQLLSDVHLEFGPMDLVGGETLLLAGDICVADYLRPERSDRDALQHQEVCRKFFHEECKKYNKVYYIAGNHEHYHGDYKKTHQILKDFLKDTNVTFLDNDAVELTDDMVLFGGTLWTDFNNSEWFAVDSAKRGMNDFHIVSYGKERVLHPDHVVLDNKKTLESLGVMLNQVYPDKKFLVMSHHAPTLMSSHPKFGGSNNPLNYAYCNQLQDYILDRPRLKYWVHGHTHDSHDYMVGDCRVVCNPRGYVNYSENVKFVNAVEFEV